MVERGGLENRYSGFGIEGSNPSLSASFRIRLRLKCNKKAAVIAAFLFLIMLLSLFFVQQINR